MADPHTAPDADASLPQGVVAWRAWSESGQAWRLYHENLGLDADLTRWEPLFAQPRAAAAVEPAGTVSVEAKLLELWEKVPHEWQRGRMGTIGQPHCIDFGKPPKAPFMVFREPNKLFPANSTTYSDNGDSAAIVDFVMALYEDFLAHLQPDARPGAMDVEALRVAAEDALQTLDRAYRFCHEEWIGLDREESEGSQAKAALDMREEIAGASRPLRRTLRTALDGAGNTQE